MKGIWYLRSFFEKVLEYIVLVGSEFQLLPLVMSFAESMAALKAEREKF